MPAISMTSQVQAATKVLADGGVIAYPTEYCFGLGCDPRNIEAVTKVLSIKRRSPDQGLILIAGNLNQVAEYADLDKVVDLDRVRQSWPGPNTWLLPCLSSVSSLIKGAHSSIAMRIPDHDFCLSLLESFGHPIVSTSANRSGRKEHLIGESAESELGSECDLVIDLPVGGSDKASTIRDALTGETLR